MVNYEEEKLSANSISEVDLTNSNPQTGYTSSVMHYAGQSLDTV